MAPAAQVHNDRLGADIARRDMVETLAPMGDASEQNAEWLQSLSDQDVLARMRQLRMTQAHDSEIVPSNYAKLEAMRDDARRFVGLGPADHGDPASE